VTMISNLIPNPQSFPHEEEHEGEKGFYKNIQWDNPTRVSEWRNIKKSRFGFNPSYSEDIHRQFNPYSGEQFSSNIYRGNVGFKYPVGSTFDLLGSVGGGLINNPYATQFQPHWNVGLRKYF
jgi:hypothetical protein